MIFTAALSTTAKTQKQLKCSQQTAGLRRYGECMCVYIHDTIYIHIGVCIYMHIHVYIYAYTYRMEYYSAIKRTKYYHLQQSGWTQGYA